VTPTIETRDPKTLLNHLLNLKLYGDAIENEFVALIREHGVTVPLEILPDGTVLSGHRRRQAAIICGITAVPVIVRHDLVADPLEAERHVILANRHREKTNEQKLREYDRLKAIEAEFAARRMKAGKPVAKPKDPTAKVPEGQPKKGEASTIAAKEVGMGRKTAEKGVTVLKAIDAAEKEGDTATATDLRQTVNRSVSAAAKKVTQPEKPAATAEQTLVSHAEKAYTTLMTHIEKLRHLVDHRDSPSVFNRANSSMATVHECIQKLKKMVS
jgi:ParB-like chromosome segregation protein Spo0J